MKVADAIKRFTEPNWCLRDDVCDCEQCQAGQALVARIAQLEARTNQDMVHIAILEERIAKYASIETHAANCARIAEDRWQRIVRLEAENERLLSAVCQWSENCVAERQCADQQIPLSPDPDPIDVAPPCDGQVPGSRTSETSAELSPARSHPSHKIRFSDASTFDEICEWCGNTDATPAGTLALAKPCSRSKTKGDAT